jgi:hypothetical protein
MTDLTKDELIALLDYVAEALAADDVDGARALLGVDDNDDDEGEDLDDDDDADPSGRHPTTRNWAERPNFGSDCCAA